MDYGKMKSANFFWIDVPTLYTTSLYKCGNQLDTARGTRVFFGFSSRTVDTAPPHTKLGSVPMRFGGRAICHRNIWYAHNAMDKVYLPVTETFGPNSYDESRLLFERKDEVFQLSICTEAQMMKCQDLSLKQGLLYNMTQGRLYGFFKAGGV